MVSKLKKYIHKSFSLIMSTSGTCYFKRHSKSILFACLNCILIDQEILFVSTYLTGWPRKPILKIKGKFLKATFNWYKIEFISKWKLMEILLNINVSEQSVNKFIFVVVIHPGTNSHNCCLSSISDLTTM